MTAPLAPETIERVRRGLDTFRDTELADPEYDSSHAHIVPPDVDGMGNVVKKGVTKVTEARVFGTLVTALCGYTWVPTKDTSGLPICSKCEAIAGERVGGSIRPA